MEHIVGLLGFFGLCFATAASGAIFRPGPWYAGLTKPSWTPPAWLFAPAWTVLFCMIAVSGWLVWRAAGTASAAAIPLSLYIANLLINGAWSALVFGLHRLDLGVVDIILLWLSIAGLIFSFYPISPSAAYLLIPYLVWVSFAGALNFAIWQLNPAVGSSQL